MRAERPRMMGQGSAEEGLGDCMMGQGDAGMRIGRLHAARIYSKLIARRNDCEIKRKDRSREICIGR